MPERPRPRTAQEKPPANTLLAENKSTASVSLSSRVGSAARAPPIRGVRVSGPEPGPSACTAHAVQRLHRPIPVRMNCMFSFTVPLPAASYSPARATSARPIKSHRRRRRRGTFSAAFARPKYRSDMTRRERAVSFIKSALMRGRNIRIMRDQSSITIEGLLIDLNGH